MTNYDPAAARMYILYYKRRLNDTSIGDPAADGSKYVYEIAKFYEIVFDSDLPGEATHYLEPWSDVEGSIPGNDRNLPIPSNYPVAGFREIQSFVGDGSSHWA